MSPYWAPRNLLNYTKDVYEILYTSLIIHIMPLKDIYGGLDHRWWYIFIFQVKRSLFNVSLRENYFQSWIEWKIMECKSKPKWCYLLVKTITEHAHNLYRMSSNLRSIAYDLHYCPDSKNYRRQNKMTFSPELYIVALKKWMVYVLYYIFNLYIHIRNF